jgi:uncharacterized membrane protein SpoIIM required for sporulation
MSLNPSREPIEPFKLLNDSLSQVAPIYVPLLIISSPAIVVNLAQQLLPALAPGISLVYGLLVTPIMTGIAIYFIYRYLKQGTADLSGAVNHALSHSVELILGMIIYAAAVFAGFICLIVPGIYLSVRLGFVLYAIVSNNCTAIDGLKYSSKLVEGRWWNVFGSMLVVLVFLIPVMIVAGIIGAIFSRQPLIAALLGTIVGIIATPPITLYYVKLYLRLQDTANLLPPV